MLQTLLGICIVIDKTGCAMVIFLPWCDFPLPDVTFVYRRCAMGMLWLLPAWCDLSTVFVRRERPANFARFSLRINHHGGGRFVNLAIVWLARLVCKQNIACHFVKSETMLSKSCIVQMIHLSIQVHQVSMSWNLKHSYHPYTMWIVLVSLPVNLIAQIRWVAFDA